MRMRRDRERARLVSAYTDALVNRSEQLDESGEVGDLAQLIDLARELSAIDESEDAAPGPARDPHAGS